MGGSVRTMVFGSIANGRPDLRRGGAVVAIALAATIGLVGCSAGGPPECAPPRSVAQTAEGTPAMSIEQGTAIELEGLTIAFAGGGCVDNGPWRAAIAVTAPADLAVNENLAVGETVELPDGRTLLVIAGTTAGDWVDVAVLPAG